MGKKHDIRMIAQWARDWGLEGYEEYDPKFKEKIKIQALKRMRHKDQKDKRQKERT